jgi:hypothetical protein
MSASTVLALGFFMLSSAAYVREGQSTRHIYFGLLAMLWSANMLFRGA